MLGFVLGRRRRAAYYKVERAGEDYAIAVLTYRASDKRAGWVIGYRLTAY